MSKRSVSSRATRIKACELAAEVMACRTDETPFKACELAAEVMACRTDETPSPLLWSLAVFFENYIDEGAAATLKDFGPKKPTRLRVVNSKGV